MPSDPTHPVEIETVSAPHLIKQGTEKLRNLALIKTKINKSRPADKGGTCELKPGLHNKGSFSKHK